MEEQNINEQNSEENINLYAIFFKYLAYWPWFVISVIACLIVAFLYLRYQPPVYNVTAAVLIKEEEQKGGNTAASPLAAIQDLGMFSMTSNFDNEVEILHSRTLIKKAVNELRLYISVAEDRVTGYDIPLYKTSPVNVFLTPEEADKLEAPVKLNMKYTTDGKLDVHAEYTLDEEEEEVSKSFDRLPAVLPTPIGVINFTRNDSLPEPMEENMNLVAYINAPTATANAYMESLTVEATSKTTTIAQLAVQNTDKQRAIDFVNCLVAFYNRDANDEKNEVNKIEMVNDITINISNDIVQNNKQENSNNKNLLSFTQKQELKEYLNQRYEIDKNNIIIN